MAGNSCHEPYALKVRGAPDSVERKGRWEVRGEMNE